MFIKIRQEPHDGSRELKLQSFACQTPNYKINQTFFPYHAHFHSPIFFLTELVLAKLRDLHENVK